MKYKTIGSALSPMSVIGLGTTGVGNYQDSNQHKTDARIRLYQQAIDLGINYFDTADLYGGGFAEEVLGRSIKGVRDKVFIGSKFRPDNNSGVGIIRSLEGSLRRLQTDYIDLYQIHWPNSSIPVCETIGTLEELVEQGKIRYIGISNFSMEEFLEAADCSTRESIVALQMEYNLLDRTPETDLIPYCEENGIAVIAYSPLNQGKLCWNRQQSETLRDVSAKYEKTPAQVVLNWLISHPPVIALTRTDSIEHLADNASSTAFTMDQEDRDSISDSFNEHQIDVPAKDIRVFGIDDRPVYRSAEEAAENRLDWIPSPQMLADNIMRRNPLKPIKLVPTSEPGGRFKYDPDPYDLLGEIKKYWAWVIAYGLDTTVPAYYTAGSGQQPGNS